MDLAPYKIQTFTGINDIPREPTAIKAGNGSHVISKFNSFVDVVSDKVDFIQDDIIRLGNSIESSGDRIEAFKEEFQPRLIQKRALGGFGDQSAIDDSTISVSAYLTQSSGIRIPLLGHNYFCARTLLWLPFQGQLYSIDLTLSSSVKPKGITFDWYFASRESYPAEIYHNFDIFAYANLEIGAGTNLEDINTTKPGLHFSLVSTMFDEYLLDVYSNYPQRIQFVAEIKSFYLYT